MKQDPSGVYVIKELRKKKNVQFQMKCKWCKSQKTYFVFKTIESSTNKQTNYWYCDDCGHLFRIDVI